MHFSAIYVWNMVYKFLTRYRWWDIWRNNGFHPYSLLSVTLVTIDYYDSPTFSLPYLSRLLNCSLWPNAMSYAAKKNVTGLFWLDSVNRLAADSGIIDLYFLVRNYSYSFTTLFYFLELPSNHPPPPVALSLLFYLS